MPSLHLRKGATLIELMMFLAFVAMTSGVVVAFFFFTTEQRVLQQQASNVQQAGVQLLQSLSNRIRSSERILTPALSTSGTILSLQLTDANMHPTVIGLSGSALYVGEAGTLKLLSPANVNISEFVVKNTSATAEIQSVLLQFRVASTTSIAGPVPYSRFFETLVTLFPDDDPGAPCSCPVPACASSRFTWQYCNDTTCTDAQVYLPCP